MILSDFIHLSHGDLGSLYVSRRRKIRSNGASETPFPWSSLALYNKSVNSQKKIESSVNSRMKSALSKIFKFHQES